MPNSLHWFASAICLGEFLFARSPWDPITIGGFVMSGKWSIPFKEKLLEEKINSTHVDLTFEVFIILI